MLTQTIESVLRGKAIREVVSTPASTSVADAVALMSSHDVGAIVVSPDGGPVEGIFTERDLMQRVVGENRDPKSTPLSAVMSPDVRSVPSSTSIKDALQMMVEHRYRHLLVRDGERLLGLISIRDLMFAQIMPGEPLPREGRPTVLRAH